MTKPFASRNLPATAFPFIIDFIQESTGAVVYTLVAQRPGGIEIPSLAELYGPVGVRMRYADGYVVEVGSDGEDGIQGSG